MTRQMTTHDDETDDGSDDETDDGSDDETDDDSDDETDDDSDDETDDGSDDETDDGLDDETDDDSDDETDDGSDDETDDDSDDETDDDSISDDSANDGSETDNSETKNSGSGNNAESESSSSNSDSSSNSSSSPGSSSGSTSNSSSNSSGSSSDSDDSDSSSMGSGISTEPATNIDVKELATRNVISGYHIEYNFSENVTCITHIEYNATRTFRKTTAIVEVLKEKSALVPMLPHGEIYKHVNIWVGENAAGLPTSLENGLVGFRVEKDWIENNNVSESLVTLQWYNKDEGWKLLDTEKTGEDEKYVYFESQTPGYSFFAITEYNAEEEKQTQLQKTLRTLTGKDNGMAEEPMKMAKMFIALALPLFMVIAGYGVLKRKI